MFDRVGVEDGRCGVSREAGRVWVWIVILIVSTESIPRYAFAMLEELGTQITALHERSIYHPSVSLSIPLYPLTAPAAET